MSETDKAIGRIEEGIAGIHATLEEIKDGKMAICQLHSHAIEELRGRKLPSNGNGRWSLQIGQLKAARLPALIIALAIAWAYYTHTQTRRVAAEAKQAAAEVATKTTSEAKSLLAAIRDEMGNQKRGEP